MDAELIFWIVSAAAAWIGLGVLWHIAKKDAENYVDMPDRESRYVNGGGNR